MPEVQDGDVVIFTQRGTALHIQDDFTFVQIKDILTPDERFQRNEGTVFNVSWMGVQVGDNIYVAGGQLKSILILDRLLNRIGTILFPYANFANSNSEVLSLAYDDEWDILYVSSVFDADSSGLNSRGRGSISAYHVGNNRWLWNRVHQNPSTAVRISPNQAASGTNPFITLIKRESLPDRLYMVDVGYGVRRADIDDDGVVNELEEFGFIAYLDGVQPQYWKDVVNWARPTDHAGNNPYPDESKLVWQPGPPHYFIVLDDGSSFPFGQHQHTIGQISEGNKINTNVFYGYLFNNRSFGYEDMSFGQLSLGTRWVTSDLNNKIYVCVNQNASNQHHNIHDYPSSPFFFAIMESRYSAEQHIDVLDENGDFDRRIYFPREDGIETITKTGYVADSSAGFFGTNQPRGIVVNGQGTRLWGVQIQNGLGPITRVELNNNDLVSYRNLRDVVPQYALEQLNGPRDSDTNQYLMFVDNFNTMSLISPMIYSTDGLVVYQGLQRMNPDASIQWDKLDGF